MESDVLDRPEDSGPGSERELLPVYLIHFGAPEWCVESSQSILESSGVDVRVTVIDNGGGEQLEDILPQAVRILRNNRNLGFAGAANRAIADWRDNFPEVPWIVIGSHDLHVDPDALRVLVEAASLNVGFGIVAPRVRGREHRLVEEAWPVRQGTIVETEWVSGTCMLLKAECLTSVEAFDEAYGSYVEDVDICLRASAAGWLVGVVVGSTAWGLGTQDLEARDTYIAMNSVLLELRRSGRVAAVRAVIRLGVRTVIHAGAAMAPTRSLEDRRRSKYMFEVRSRALRGAISAWSKGRWSE